jgi:hypothetical protein
MGQRPTDIEIRVKPDSRPAAPQSAAPPQPLLSEAPRSRSFAPSLRPRSIFTLRPFSHTEQPPAEPAAQESSVKRASRKWVWAAAGLIGGVAFAGWALSRRGSERIQAPVVLVNGTPQTKQTPSGKTQRWATNAEVTVVLDPSIDALGSDAREAVMNGFGAWLGSGAGLPKLRFDDRRRASPKLERDGISSIMYAPIEISGHKGDLAITIGFADPDTGRITEADIVINSAKAFGVLSRRAEQTKTSEKDRDDERESERDDDEDEGECLDCRERYDLQSVVTHEVGHFFGLGEDQEDSNATMFFKTSRCELKKRDLGPLDTSTMVELYPLQSSDEPPEAAAQKCAAAPASRGVSGPAALLPITLWLCAIARRQRRLAASKRAAAPLGLQVRFDRR